MGAGGSNFAVFGAGVLEGRNRSISFWMSSSGFSHLQLQSGMKIVHDFRKERK